MWCVCHNSNSSRSWHWRFQVWSQPGNFERHKNKKDNKMLEIQLSEESTCLVWMQPGFVPQREERDRHRDTRQTWAETQTVAWGVCYTLEEDVSCTLFLSILLPWHRVSTESRARLGSQEVLGILLSPPPHHAVVIDLLQITASFLHGW